MSIFRKEYNPRNPDIEKQAAFKDCNKKSIHTFFRTARLYFQNINVRTFIRQLRFKLICCFTSQSYPSYGHVGALPPFDGTSTGICARVEIVRMNDATIQLRSGINIPLQYLEISWQLFLIFYQSLLARTGQLEKFVYINIFCKVPSYEGKYLLII